ncbi:glycosyl hydrolase family 43 [Bacteroidia bacterium]|nr:glycosyl hydrolase family 43 [Bacteroidia bacterium]
MRKTIPLLILLVLGLSGLSRAQNDTFRNPLLESGPDPWVLRHEGMYYFMATSGGRKLVLHRTADMTDLQGAETKTVWTATAEGNQANARDLWAPEIHFLDGRWYIYYSSAGGRLRYHQLYVLENANADPFQGEFTMKGRVSTDSNDSWAIDGSLFSHRGSLYLIWSGWQTYSAPGQTTTQCIYIARMADPLTLSSERVLLSRPELEWERRNIVEGGGGPNHAVYVNEGPQALIGPRGRYVHIVYSASACWTPDYCLGMLSARADADLLDPRSWSKSPRPVFEASPTAGVYGPGHNGFFCSPDGKEEYIVYHARDTKMKSSPRSPRMQRFTWDRRDFPRFGSPVATSQPLPKPSGTK